MFKSIGYNLEVVMFKNEGFFISKIVEGNEEPFECIASEHYIGRLGLEFISLKWFLNQAKAMLKETEMSLLVN